MRTAESLVALLLLSMIVLTTEAAARQIVPAVPRDIQDQLTTLGLNDKQLDAIRGIIKRAGEVERQRQLAHPPSSWSVQLPTRERFVVLADFKDAAVLDRETGLVWERDPNPVPTNWYGALQSCYSSITGGRHGWRLPAVEELTSLSDHQGLPVDATFTQVAGHNFWSATTIARQNDPWGAWGVTFDVTHLIDPADRGKEARMRAWCVRGGLGHDGATHPFNR